MFLVYFPVAHMVWGVDGAMNGIYNANAIIKAIDFAGGTVVHMTCGWSSLILCMMLGRAGLREGADAASYHGPLHGRHRDALGGLVRFQCGQRPGRRWHRRERFPHHDAGRRGRLLRVGLRRVDRNRKSSVLGFCSGAIGGLVVVAPSCGYVNATGAVIIGLVGGLVPYFGVVKLKAILGYDDALDAFGVHAFGGTIGVLLAGFLARTDINPRLAVHLGGYVGKTLWVEQLKALFIVLAIAVIGTFIAGFIARLFVGLRPSAEIESIGLDLTEHGEEG